MAISYPVSVPEICVVPAPAQEFIAEPKSPFASLSQFISPVEDDGYRPVLLTPPAALSPGGASPLSPLRPADAPVKGLGVDRERFEALLRASRERNAAVGSKKPHDLRKEIALKAHKTKQMERRALFLSKVQAPPSPSAATLPKTPPESPAILHYTLPSPGLVSPLALFDSVRIEDAAADTARKPWVEQVDFRLPEDKRTKRLVPAPPTRSLPSLDQITARLGAQRQAAASANPARRLPAFLQSGAGARSPPRQVSPPPAVDAPSPKPRAPAPIGVGRLQMPARIRTDSLPTPPTPVPTVIVSSTDEPEEEPVVLKAAAAKYALPKSPGSPKVPNLEITTTVVSRSSRVSPVNLTMSNLQAFNSRARTAKDMLFTLRRRNGAPGDDLAALTRAGEDDVKSMRRRSAPSELQPRERHGFKSPMLALPGAF